MSCARWTRRRLSCCCGGRSPIPSVGWPIRRRSIDAALAMLAERSRRRCAGGALGAGACSEHAADFDPTGGSSRSGRCRRDRGCAAAQGARLRPAGRPPLRLHLGLDQGDAWLRRRCLALLPGGDAGGRRGSALHRSPHGHPRLRGHRQRRSAGAAGRRRRGPGGRPGRACPSARSTSLRPASTWRWRRSPMPPTRTRARPGPRSASTAPRLLPITCATPTIPAPSSSAAARATATRTISPVGSSDQQLLPDGSRGAPLLCANRPRLRG